MCDIAPMGMECENDKYKHEMTCCAVHHLSQALNNLFQSIPIVGAMVQEYHCPHFKPKGWWNRWQD